MSTGANARDLLVLAADKNIESAVTGLISRAESLGIREILTDIYVHPQRDPGCLRRSPEFLRAFANQYLHALVVFDREGCGAAGRSRIELENELEGQLSQAGWQDRAAVAVLDPELEIWVWSDSPEVPRVLGWQDASPDLWSWLIAEGFVRSPGTKPERPKEAVEAAIRRSRKRRSSSLYFELARRVSLRRCTDPAFAKFRTTLKTWFPA